jgi:hypothetical protein
MAWPAVQDGAMDFFAKHFVVFGIDFQVWMPIVVGALAIYVLYLWKTDQFRR